MQVRVRYFAALREATGLDEETIESDAPTARALYAELMERHAGLVREDLVCASVNRRLGDLDSTIKDGDEVVFIPPVAGG